MPRQRDAERALGHDHGHDHDHRRDQTRRDRSPRHQHDRRRARPPVHPTDLNGDAPEPPAAPRPKRRRPDGQESFKCHRCRAFIGPTVSGGRHRNHCPLCLSSRHVDANTPGDRASSCRALMAPVGTFHRPKGEQVVLHRCLGCGLERHNRVAADDNPLALLRLPPVPPRVGRPAAPPLAVEEEATG
ncbi:MAG: hypothetical protein AVDCRST_MAG73-502 [uncultured Thermomicrobiales bacterium]|uniref:RNHCP domain-containing protein n=1 Tax=uncultured Thermomicrobiales bacterium TaxID=1645740 RepID=A0A6J4TM85_9BACT|nr:MAG: hypothetical protein AVDCRST_MAG73-502 [uncultured Thermomicrobiales bacterium]